MLPGIKVELGGKVFVAPSLITRDIARFDEDGTFDLSALQDSTNKRDAVEVHKRVPRASLLRNYPEATVESALDESDLWALWEASQRIQRVSLGSERPTEDGERPEAEAPVPAES